MKSTFSILFYLKKGSERKDGRAMIMARIYNRQNQMRRNSEPDATFRGLS
jgi:hypothetical protein